eukprot:4612860-Pleurochrysis_carterae.AAC.4
MDRCAHRFEVREQFPGTCTTTILGNASKFRIAACRDAGMTQLQPNSANYYYKMMRKNTCDCTEHEPANWLMSRTRPRASCNQSAVPVAHTV